MIRGKNIFIYIVEKITLVVQEDLYIRLYSIDHFIMDDCNATMEWAVDET